MAEEAAALIGDRFGADRGEAEVVVGFVEGRTAKADCRQPIDHLRQLDLIGDRQHDEVTSVVGLKAVARFKTSVTNLHDLIGQTAYRREPVRRDSEAKSTDQAWLTTSVSE